MDTTWKFCHEILVLKEEDILHWAIQSESLPDISNDSWMGLVNFVIPNT
jgi:hypothetical protein